MRDPREVEDDPLLLRVRDPLEERVRELPDDERVRELPDERVRELLVPRVRVRDPLLLRVRERSEERVRGA